MDGKSVCQNNLIMGLLIQQVETDHYLQQQIELDRKAKELEERERQLQAKNEQLRRQQQQQQQQGDGGGGNNWPPLPQWFPIKPCFYMEIEVEIPNAFQVTVKQMYYIWMAHIVLLEFNFIGGLSMLFTGNLFAHI